DTLQPPELFFLAAAEFFECHLHAHLRDRHVGQVVERQPLNEGAEGPCEGVRFLPTFGGQVPGHPGNAADRWIRGREYQDLVLVRCRWTDEFRCPSRTASSRSRT